MLKINDQKMLQLVTLHILARSSVSISTPTLCKITNNPLHRINRMLSALRTSTPPLIKENAGGHIFIGNVNELDPLPEDIQAAMLKVDSFLASMSKSEVKNAPQQSQNKLLEKEVNNDTSTQEKNTIMDSNENKTMNTEKVIINVPNKNLELNLVSEDDDLSSCVSDLQIQILKLVAGEKRSYIQTQLVRQFDVTEQEIIDATTPLVENGLITKTNMDIFPDVVYKGTDKTQQFLKSITLTEDEQRDIDNAYTIILSAIKEQKSISEDNLIRIVMNTLPIKNRNLIKRKIDSMVKKEIIFSDNSKDNTMYFESKTEIKQVNHEINQTKSLVENIETINLDEEKNKHIGNSNADNHQLKTVILSENKENNQKEDIEVPYVEFDFSDIKNAINNLFQGKLSVDIDNTENVVDAINSISNYVTKLEDENKKWRKIASKIAIEIEQEFNK